MKSNCKQFNKSIQGASARAYYIDRIDIRVNDLSIRTRVQRELKTADKRGMIHKFKISHIRYGESFDVGFPKQTQIRGFKLQLSRPSKNLMNRLGAILVNSHYTISWIEIAYDINTESDDDAMELIQVLAGMIVIPRISRSPTFQDQDGKITKCPIGPIVSVYFSYENIESKREHKQAKEKRATKNKMFKIYIPKEGDKLYGSTSVHTEFCLKGADMIESFGILTIGDVVTFDLSSFYGQHVQIRGVNKAKIGQLLRAHESKSAVSDKQCQKDFDRKFRPERAVCHKVYHHEKGILRDGLIDCGAKWLARKT